MRPADARYFVCCGALHAKTAAWLVLLLHAGIVALALANGVLYMLGLADDGLHETDIGMAMLSAGSWGLAGVMLVSVVWLLFIALLAYGLVTCTPVCVLFHIISAVVTGVYLMVQVVLLAMSRGLSVHVLWLVLVALAIWACLYVEWLCYLYMRDAVKHQQASEMSDTLVRRSADYAAGRHHHRRIDGDLGGHYQYEHAPPQRHGRHKEFAYYESRR